MRASPVCLAAIVASTAACAPTPPVAAPDDLLTAAQYARIEAAAEEELRAAAAEPAEPGAPRIVIERPDLAAPLASPISVHARFEPAPGARVDPATFSVRYRKGLLTLDITEQALRFMRVTPEGARGERIPIGKPGRHTLVLEVADSSRRIGRQTVTFEIAAGGGN